MKELSIKELDIMLCSTGYLPPRDEEELLFFCEMYSDYKSCIQDKHVDVEAIFSGTCCAVSDYNCDRVSSSTSYSIVTGDDKYSMAARHFGKLPKEVLDKMKNQHRIIDDDDES